MGIGSYLALRVAVLPAFSDFERKSVEEALARVAVEHSAVIIALDKEMQRIAA